MEEISGERFKELEQVSPGTAARARAHVAEHMRAMMLMQEQQEAMLGQMAQQGAQSQAMSGGQGGGSPVGGAAGPGQDPESPKVRSNENERGEGREAQGEAMRGAPNAGAQ
jgi:hypothetical protein